MLNELINGGGGGIEFFFWCKMLLVQTAIIAEVVVEAPRPDDVIDPPTLHTAQHMRRTLICFFKARLIPFLA